MKVIVIFFILQGINVILSTMKSLVMIRVNNKHLAVLVNALQYGFYTVVVKQVAILDLTTTVTITIVTNVVGVYASYCIMDKVKKDRVWLIKTQPVVRDKGMKIEESLKKCSVSFTRLEVQEKVIFEIFSYSQEQSRKVREMLDSLNGPVKVFITEMTGKL